MITGIGVSPGIAIARATLFRKQNNDGYECIAQNVQDELVALKKAHQLVIEETQNLYDRTLSTMGEEQANIFVAHKMILEDPELIETISQSIECESCTAAYAIDTCMNSYIAMFEAMEDEYMRERAADMRDIKERFLCIALNNKGSDLSNLREKSIIVARELTPSDTASMDIKNVAGIVTQTGGRTSHTAIMARSLGIPAVVSAEPAIDDIQAGDIVIINGETGEIYCKPDQSTVTVFEARQAAQTQAKEMLKAYKGKETITTDGKKIELVANIGMPQELAAVKEKDAEGIGLFRSEFLFMDRETFPTEEEQFQAYKSVIEGMDGKRVIVRTLDVGGDKKLPALDMPQEENPFLGYRAIRLCLDRKDLFKTQLRALMRASVYGNLNIMFPMISCVQEIRQAKEVLNEIQNELLAGGVAFSQDVLIGIMIEIPAAAIISDVLAKEVDFFSIGTNDLIQYTMAADRGNEKVAHLYTQYHPAVLRLIADTINAAHANGIFCGMCGEAAGDERLAPVWIGMGLDEFSVNSSSILQMRKAINGLSYEDCKQIAVMATELSSSDDVDRYLG